ncbi:DUF1847 domain-containing protein [Ilyobacter sp.]|uniref:DUF1847 domain-containing protein n=1 Tax=Ilyobacter sp. TaxID=3100343 RepID=UPI0035632F43
MYTCGICKVHACRTGEKEKMPKNCPCLEKDRDVIDKSKELYKDEENAMIAYQSALIESWGYCKKTRIEETMEFAKRCGYKNIGIAFCVGLHREMRLLHNILTANGFNVNSVICKSGSIPKEELNIKNDQKVRPCTYEPMCNPIGQALYLNKAKTDFNILLGLCVGHDSLAIKHLDSPVTILAVKDRVLGHNPLAAIYLSEGYYSKKLYPEK